MLEKRVIQVSTSEKFVELQKSGQTPVCLLPTRKACREFNDEMLASLDSKVHELECVDEVDESGGTRRWNKKAADYLEKLNSDSNMTAGLEAKLRLAVGARVMLRRNIDTSAGLVNGAIGTIRAIVKRHISVQFDHMTEPYNVEMVKSMKLLRVQKAVSADFGIRCDHPQVPRPVARLCYCRPLRQSV